MSNQFTRNVRRLASRAADYHGQQMAQGAFINATFNHAPRFMPRFAWYALISIVARGNHSRVPALMLLGAMVGLCVQAAAFILR